MTFKSLLPSLTFLLFLAAPATWANACDQPALAFKATGGGEYCFNTGVLAGKLRAEGESVGPGEVIYSDTGQVISRVYGWLNHYRVFTAGVRYGRGMRHLPSEATAGEDGSVTVTWPAEAGQPFRMTASYRWVAPNILDVETQVRATEHLPGFDLFLASYFPNTFSDVRLPLTDNQKVNWAPVREADGYRQAFHRDKDARALLEDGRWELEPHPIEWTLRYDPVWRPMSLRRDPDSGVTVLFMTDPEETFVVYTPHATQRHYALYYSLFGRDLAPGDSVSARARAVVLLNPEESELLEVAEGFFGGDQHRGTVKNSDFNGFPDRSVLWH